MKCYWNKDGLRLYHWSVVFIVSHSQIIIIFIVGLYIKPQYSHEFWLLSHHIISWMLNVEGGWTNTTIDHHIWNVPMFNVRCTKSIYSNVDISEMWKHHLQYHPHPFVPIFLHVMPISFVWHCIWTLLLFEVIIFISVFFRFVAHHHQQ